MVEVLEMDILLIFNIEDRLFPGLHGATVIQLVTLKKYFYEFLKFNFLSLLQYMQLICPVKYVILSINFKTEIQTGNHFCAM